MKPLFFVCILVGLFSCTKQNCLKYFELHFPATITAGDTFAIGDTLWVEMSLPNQLKNYKDGELVDLSGFDLFLSLGIEQMDTNYVNSALHDFGIVEKTGAIEYKGYTAYIHFKSITEKKLHFGIIAQKQGVYFFTLSLPILYGVLEEAGEMRVDNSSCNYHDITKYSGVHFNEGVINYYLNENYPCLQSSPSDPLMICYKDSAFTASGGGYAFVVQ